MKKTLILIVAIILVALFIQYGNFSNCIKQAEANFNGTGSGVMGNCSDHGFDYDPNTNTTSITIKRFPFRKTIYKKKA